MSRRIVAGAVAMITALAGGSGVVAYARNADARALAGQEAVKAFVAVKEVPVGMTAGEAVSSGLMKQELIARKAVPDGALSAVDQTNSPLVATSAIAPGELVLRSRFAANAASPGVLAVPAGKLAVSVALDDPSHVGSFVQAGSTVSVFDTFNIQETDKNDVSPAGDHLQDRHEFTRATRLLLSGLQVLAVGAATTPARPADSADGTAAASSSGASNPLAQVLVTLAVTQAQAEKLVHGSRTGTLTLALQGTGATPTPGPGSNDRSLFEVTK